MGNSQHKSRVTLDDSDDENELHEEEDNQEQHNITHEIEEKQEPALVDVGIQEKEARFKEVNDAFNILLIYLKIANQRRMFTEDECRKINDCVNRFI